MGFSEDGVIFLRLFLEKVVYSQLILRLYYMFGYSGCFWKPFFVVNLYVYLLKEVLIVVFVSGGVGLSLKKWTFQTIRRIFRFLQRKMRGILREKQMFLSLTSNLTLLEFGRSLGVC